MPRLSHRKLTQLIAVALFFVSFLCFARLVSPSISFWDCGEYVGASNTVAIPHPPGNPLYILIARCCIMLFFFIKDIALRVNLLSVIASACIVLCFYLTIVRVFVGVLGEPDTSRKKIITHVSGIVGSLSAAFTNTMIFSSVQAEAKASISFLPIILCTWLCVVWFQSVDKQRDRYIVLVSYLAFLGIGIHQQTMMILLPLSLFVMISDKQKRKNILLWISICMCGLIMYSVSTFVIAGTVTVVITGSIALIEYRKGKKNSPAYLSFFIVLFACIGFSVHTFIPIRSSLCPIIDENHPVTWKAFCDYLDRKQYGSQSMVTRMLWRRGTWSHQFGIEEHMGFGGFFMTQLFQLSPDDTKQSIFSNGFTTAGMGTLILYLLPTVAMLFGMYYLYRRYRIVILFLILLQACSTAGLVLYMNFGDGTIPEENQYKAWVKAGKPTPMPKGRREVRVRDYFFLAGFLFHGMWIGLAAGSILHLLYNRREKILSHYGAPACALLFFVFPIIPYMHNAPKHDRTHDSLPFDYAYNMLMSIEKGGILFTNGDNDTFPLWALQEAYGIRKDVRVVNLSLLNTRWYIRQMKQLEPKVPISFSDEEIEQELMHVRNPFEHAIGFELKKAAITLKLPDSKNHPTLKVQDQMIINIVDANKWQKPLYFSSTVSPDNFIGLDSYLQLQGLVYRIMNHELKPHERFNSSVTTFLFDKVYRFNNVGDGSMVIDKTHYQLMSNYINSFLHCALSLKDTLQILKTALEQYPKQSITTHQKPQQTYDSLTICYDETVANTRRKLNQASAILPSDWRPRVLHAQLLIAIGNHDQALELIHRGRSIDPKNKEYMQITQELTDYFNASKAEQNPLQAPSSKDSTDPWISVSMECINFAEVGQYDSMFSLIETYQKQYPMDPRPHAFLRSIEQEKQTVIKK